MQAVYVCNTCESLSQSPLQRSLPSLCLQGQVGLSVPVALSPWWPWEGGLRAQQLGPSVIYTLLSTSSETYIHGHTIRICGPFVKGSREATVSPGFSRPE